MCLSKCSSRGVLWLVIIALTVFTIFCFVMSTRNPIVTTENKLDKIIEMVKDSILSEQTGQKLLETIGKTDTTFVYNLQGFGWLACAIISLIILLVIFSSIKYEWVKILKVEDDATLYNALYRWKEGINEWKKEIDKWKKDSQVANTPTPPEEIKSKD